MSTIRPLALALGSALALVACSESAAPPAQNTAAPAPASAPAPVKPAPAPAAPTAETLLEAALAGPARSAENSARDAYRHPRETLGFFGLAPTQTVVEITPGGGWYTEILAPYLRESGRYIGAIVDASKAGSDGARDYYTRSNDALRAKLAADPSAYDRAALVEFDLAAPVFGAEGSADLVLTFRNVHNWTQGGHAAAMFKGFHDVLKPGGVLGVVEHRAATDVPEGDRSGYMSENQVIALATAAGFTLDGKSEVNANPKDTRDHPNGVWTLPPVLRVPEGTEPQVYRDIGESDRMTLRFVKPAAATAATAPDAD